MKRVMTPDLSLRPTAGSRLRPLRATGERRRQASRPTEEASS